MTDDNKIIKLREWVTSSHSYLSERSEYAKGYKQGMTVAKNIVIDILDDNE